MISSVRRARRIVLKLTPREYKSAFAQHPDARIYCGAQFTPLLPGSYMGVNAGRKASRVFSGELGNNGTRKRNEELTNEHKKAMTRVAPASITRLKSLWGRCTSLATSRSNNFIGDKKTENRKQ